MERRTDGDEAVEPPERDAEAQVAEAATDASADDDEDQPESDDDADQEDELEADYEDLVPISGPPIHFRGVTS